MRLKYYLITVLFILSAASSFAQFPNNPTPIGNDKTLTVYKGGLRAEGGMIFLVLPDTVAANNNSYLKPYNGAAFFNSTDSSIYARLNGFWVKQRAAGGGGGTPTDTTGIRVQLQAGTNISITGTYPVLTVSTQGLSPDTIFFGSPFHVNQKTVTLLEVNSTDSGYVTPAFFNYWNGKLDSVVLRGNVLKSFAFGDSITVGTITGGGSGIDSTAIHNAVQSPDSTYFDLTTPSGITFRINTVGVAGGGGGGSGTTLYDTQIASGSTAFTFTTVPASYADYIIFINGCVVRPITDYTTSGNIVTIPTIITGDYVRYQRIK